MEISVPPIRGQVSYFIALHEIGHLIGPGRSAPRLESEANAWLWALSHSVVEPTPATRRSIARRLRGYLEWARNRQYRRVPPRIPPREHPFWRLLALGGLSYLRRAATRVRVDGPRLPTIRATTVTR